MANRLGAHDDFQEKTQFFISVGDLMSAVLLVFVFLLAATLLKIQDGFGQKAAMADTYQQAAEENRRVAEDYRSMSEAYKRPAAAFHQLQNDFYTALNEEFRDDLTRWGASIDRDTLSIRFLEPEVLFGSGKAELTEHFEEILNDFFPRYIAMLAYSKFRDDVEEIRIEGHTSSEWEAHPEGDMAYFENMRLSMNRTWNVLEYCLGRLGEKPVREWVEGRLTANGLSSSKPILVNGREDKRMSRRVEFRVRVAAEKRIGQILTPPGETTSARDGAIASEAGNDPLLSTAESQGAKPPRRKTRKPDTPNLTTARVCSYEPATLKFGGCRCSSSRCRRPHLAPVFSVFHKVAAPESRIQPYRAEEFEKDPELFMAIVHPDDRDGIVRHLDDVANPGPETHEQEFRILTRSGEVRWMAHACRIVRAGDARVGPDAAVVGLQPPAGDPAG